MRNIDYSVIRAKNKQEGDPESEYGSSFSVSSNVWPRDGNIGPATTSIGGPMTFRGQIIIDSSCCYGDSTLPSAGLSACGFLSCQRR